MLAQDLGQKSVISSKVGHKAVTFHRGEVRPVTQRKLATFSGVLANSKGNQTI
jgi:hypothetical protein